MKKCLLAGVAALALVAAVGTRAEAQFTYQRPQTNPFGQPAVSPYLNLNRAGTSAGINYYALVKPQMETAKSLQQLQQYTFGQGTGPILGAEENNRMQSTTGHVSRFFNYGAYFPQATIGGRQGTVLNNSLGGQGGNTGQSQFNRYKSR